MRTLFIADDVLNDLFQGEERQIVWHVFKKNGYLRSSKPAIKYQIVKRPMYGRVGNPVVDYRENDLLDAKSAYVWRMVVFAVSDNPQHQCVPVCADMDLPIEDHNERRALCKTLDALADRIVNLFPPTEWAGTIRWGQAYGLIGTPRYDDTGAIIYR